MSQNDPIADIQTAESPATLLRSRRSLVILAALPTGVVAGSHLRRWASRGPPGGGDRETYAQTDQQRGEEVQADATQLHLF